jgi:hypothetical protein
MEQTHSRCCPRHVLLQHAAGSAFLCGGLVCDMLPCCPECALQLPTIEQCCCIVCHLFGVCFVLCTLCYALEYTSVSLAPASPIGFVGASDVL